MWFDTWEDLARVAVVGIAAYATVIVVLRLSGKRTLSKLNAFDLVVTVALGSTLATILLNRDVSWTEGALAVALLAGLQFVVAWASARLSRGRSVVTAPPTLLLREGRPIPAALRGQRVTMSEVRQAVRATGNGDLSSVAAVVLESDGTLSVVTRASLGNGSALDDVTGATGAGGTPD